MTVHTAITLEQQGLAGYLRGNIKLEQGSPPSNRINNMIHIHDEPNAYAIQVNQHEIHGDKLNILRNIYDKKLRESGFIPGTDEYEKYRRELYYGFDQDEQDWMEELIDTMIVDERQREQVRDLQKTILLTEVYRTAVQTKKQRIENQILEIKKQNKYIEILKRRLLVAEQILTNPDEADKNLKKFNLEMMTRKDLQWGTPIEDRTPVLDRRPPPPRPRERDKTKKRRDEIEQDEPPPDLSQDQIGIIYQDNLRKQKAAIENIEIFITNWTAIQTKRETTQKDQNKQLAAITKEYNITNRKLSTAKKDYDKTQNERNELRMKNFEKEFKVLEAQKNDLEKKVEETETIIEQAKLNIKQASLDLQKEIDEQSKLERAIEAWHLKNNG